jgi:hypothetical protein
MNLNLNPYPNPANLQNLLRNLRLPMAKLRLLHRRPEHPYPLVETPRLEVLSVIK